MVQVIVGKIIQKLSEGKQKLFWISGRLAMELLWVQVMITEDKSTENCMKEIQGKSTLVWVSARFELARVRVIRSQLYYVEQTKLLARFRKDFALSVWNFCCWGADIPSGKISLTVRRKERWLLSASQKGAERKGPKWLQLNFYIINPKNYLMF